MPEVHDLGTIKRGDTFAFLIEVVNDAGEKIIGAAANLKSQARDRKKNLITDLVITEAAEPGEYLIKALENTDAWPSTVLLDIKYVGAGGAESTSDTLRVYISEAITDG